MKKQFLYILIIMAILFAAMLIFYPSIVHQNGDLPESRSFGKAAIGGPFTLVDQAGKTVKDTDFRGQFMLVYFGFTYCPDICPTALLTMTNAINNLGKDGEEVTPILISVDPERDKPDVLAQYVANFHPRLVGLTGTPEQVKAAADAYKVYYTKVEQKDSSLAYVVDHSGFIFLMSPKGEYLAHFPHDVAEQSLIDSLRRFIHE